MKKILVLNLGSTTTKIAVYHDCDEILKISINYSRDELNKYQNIWDQKEMRKEGILKTLDENGYRPKDFDCIACRGGNMKPVRSGVYVITKEILDDIRSEKYGVHPTGVGNIISYELGSETGIPVITADPPVTDELCPLAKYSGIKEMPKISSFHALNQKRTAKIVSSKLGREYYEMNMIVIHLGGGISVAAHQKGYVIDVNNALDGDGPFSPERSGAITARDIIKACYSQKYTEAQMLKMITGGGGLMSYLSTNNAREVEKKISEGDGYAREVYEAMAYQVSKETGAMAAVLKGKVDAIALTGSLANSEMLVNWIKERIEYIAPIFVIPGENEMIALAESAYRYLNGEKAQSYLTS